MKTKVKNNKKVLETLAYNSNNVKQEPEVHFCLILPRIELKEKFEATFSSA